MTYAVVWRVTAQQEADRIRAAHWDPDAVRRETDRIDYDLRRTPRDKGESRGPGLRVWYLDVLGVLYRIDEAADTVHVLAVALARRR